MTTALVSYQFDETPVRVVMIAGEPWFVANDVCRILALTNPRKAVGDLDSDEKGVTISDTLGGQQEMNVVSESGMYALIFKSRKPQARRFRKWVTADVLPSLRKTGKYVLHDPPPAPALMMDMDPPRLNASVALVREARRLFGPKTAREVWIRLGLPVSIAEAQANHIGDTLAEPLRQWLTGREVCTAQEAAIGLGIENPSVGDRQRIAALLRLFGWDNKAARIDGEKRNAWFAPAAQPWHGIHVDEEEA